MAEMLWSASAWNCLSASAYSSVSPIAFSKIDGFDVTPFSPSRSMSARSSPFSIRLSLQIVQPDRLAACLELLQGIHAVLSLADASCALAAAITFSVVKPNFFIRSSIGADAPKLCMPILAPAAPT